MTKLTRVSLEDIVYNTARTPSHYLWMDHVLFDTPNTVASAIKNAHKDYKAFTIAEEVAILKYKYKEAFEAAKSRGAVLYVALPKEKFKRVLYSEWLDENSKC